MAENPLAGERRMCAVGQHENENSAKEKQNTRGATHMPRVWARRSRKEVQFNKLGQPIGINKGEFVEFLGTIVRNGSLIPLDIKDWHKVPQSLKKAAIDLIKTKSVENKEHRAQKKMNHNTGKRSFVEVSDDMKVNTKIAERERQHEIGGESNDQEDGIIQDDITDYDPSRVDLFAKCYTKNGSTSNALVSRSLMNMRALRKNLSQSSKDKGPNDTFSQILKDKEGRVLMYGLGVSPSDIQGAMPSRAACQRMNMEYQNQIEKLIKRADDQDREISELKKMNIQRSSNDSPVHVSRGSSSSFEHLSSSNYQLTSTISKKALKVWATVKLKSMFDPPKFVAIGRIEGLEQSKLVGQKELAKNWCEVKINVALELGEELIRPFYEFTNIGEVVGKAIAWPIHLLSNFYFV